MKIHQHNAGHMTKMAAMPNTLEIFFQGTAGLILMKLCMKHQKPKPFIFCSNYDPGFDLDLFYGKVKFCNLGFYMGKCDNDGIIIASCDLEFG